MSGVPSHPAWQHGDPAVVARRILAEPAYRGLARTTTAKPAESFWQLAWDWLVQHVLRPIFGPVLHAASASRGVGTLVGIVLIVLSLAALVFVVARLAFAFGREARPKRGDATATGALAENERSSRAWRDAAREAARRGDWGGAIAAFFSAARRVLDERDAIAFDAARTPGEYARLVRREAIPGAADFAALTGTFERARYAASPPTAADAAAAERAFAVFAPEIGS